MPQAAHTNVPTVLVVDDDPRVRQLLEIVLTSEGWLVEQAESGAEGLTRCRRERFDVAVLDHWMPGLTGIEVAGRLFDEGSATPIVIFSACLDPALVEAGESVGAVVIDKLNWAELVRVCSRVAEQRRETRVAVAPREFHVARAGA